MAVAKKKKEAKEVITKEEIDSIMRKISNTSGIRLSGWKEGEYDNVVHGKFRASIHGDSLRLTKGKNTLFSCNIEEFPSCCSHGIIHSFDIYTKSPSVTRAFSRIANAWAKGEGFSCMLVVIPADWTGVNKGLSQGKWKKVYENVNDNSGRTLITWMKRVRERVR